MGQIADDMMCGFQCSWCGTCFGGEHGFPVVCKDCAEGYSNKKLAELGLQRATIKEIGDCTDEELRDNGFEVVK